MVQMRFAAIAAENSIISDGQEDEITTTYQRIRAIRINPGAPIQSSRSKKLNKFEKAESSGPMLETEIFLLRSIYHMICTYAIVAAATRSFWIKNAKPVPTLFIRTKFSSKRQ